MALHVKVHICLFARACVCVKHMYVLENISGALAQKPPSLSFEIKFLIFL